MSIARRSRALARRSCASGRRSCALTLLVVLVGLLPARAAAQLPPTPSDQARFSLLTVGPGPQVHALFGHGALRLVDPVYRLDLTFNYGTFQFGPDFIPRFIRGRLDYFLSVSDAADLLGQAEYDGRSVDEQLLDLDGPQVRALYVALVDNAQLANRTYRYDFLFDNCSTRIVDMLEDVLGPTLALPPRDGPAPTFREQVDAFLDDAPWLDLGIHLSLGSEVDRPSNVGETWFLPGAFARALDSARLDGHPVVLASRTLIEAPPSRGSDTPAALHPLLLAWVSAGLAALGLLRRLVTGRRRGLLVDRLVFGVVGVAGSILLFFWVGTLHHVADHNWNLAWAWPSHLWIVFWLGRRPLPRWLRLYLLAGAGAAAVASTGLAIPQVLPEAVPPLCALIVLRTLTILAPERAPAGRARPASP